MPKYKTYYSGNVSRGFWKRINKLKGIKHSYAYNMGCILQDMEHKANMVLWLMEKKESKDA